MTGETKQCRACKQYKPTTDFWKRNVSPDRLQYDCKKCSRERVRKYREDNPEYAIKRKKFDHKYRALHGEEINARVKQYRDERIEEYRTKERERSWDRRRKAGVPMRGAWKKYRVKKGQNAHLTNNRLPAQPLYDFLQEYCETTGESLSSICERASVAFGHFKDKETLTEHKIDKMLLAIDMPEAWHYLYPTEE